jgi:hypothetical protein
VQEGLFSSWAHGAGFGNWLLPVLKMYRAALPSNVKFLFPGLSPGEEISGIRQNSITFAAAAASAINQCDGLAVHGYWATQHGWPMAKTIQQIETAVLPFPSKPVFVTEASNNKASMTPEHKANEYAQFWRELAKIGNVRGVTFFVASASNPDWDWNGGSAETWVGVGMGTKVRSQM